MQPYLIRSPDEALEPEPEAKDEMNLCRIAARFAPSLGHTSPVYSLSSHKQRRSGILTCTMCESLAISKDSWLALFDQ